MSDQPHPGAKLRSRAWFDNPDNADMTRSISSAT